MIVGLGIDMVEIERIHASLVRFGATFIGRILHETEQAAMPAQGEHVSPRLAEFVAARFAAKEAGAKALGTGIAEGVSMQDIRVVSAGNGKPQISLHGKAKEYADALGVCSCLVSLTHSRSTAGAVVILEAPDTRNAK